MAAKPKFPGRRVNRTGRSGIWYIPNIRVDAMQPVYTFKADERSENIVRRLNEFRNLIGDSDEVIRCRM